MTSLCRQCNVRDIDTLDRHCQRHPPRRGQRGQETGLYAPLSGLGADHLSAPVTGTCFATTRSGLVVYEEHILQICEAFAGLQPGRADVLRRALNKQNHPVIEEIREEFFASSAQHAGIHRKRLWKCGDLVTGFAGYAFCKAHSTAYGVEAYQSAWLK